MKEDNSNKENNPLKWFAYIFIFSLLYDAYDIVQGVEITIFIMYRMIIDIIFLYLFYIKSKYAGQFLFYSTLPIYPIFYLFHYLGFIKVSFRWEVFIILMILYIAGMITIWVCKEKYSKYLKTKEVEQNQYVMP